jgi:hypothetical protein
MQLSDLTALGRPIDPNYPTNRAIVALTVVVMVAAIVVRLLMGTAWLASARWGIGAGLAVFLAWALARELDPDHDLSAFVGAGLMLVGIFLFDLPALLMLFWLLVALRSVNRTSGLPVKMLDSLLLLGLGGWLAWQGQWVAGVMTAIAFLLDGRLSPRLGRQVLFAGLALVVTVIVSVFNGQVRMASGPSLPVVVAVVVMAGLYATVIVASREVKSVGDVTGERLSSRRVQAAQIIALATALAMAWWAGKSGAVALLPLWAAMLGAALYRLGSSLWASHVASSRQ